MRIDKRPLSDLNPAPYNPRTISDAAMAGLEASIVRWGIVEPIVWNERTGHVVGGHQRLQVLERRGTEFAEVVVVDLPDTEERALNLTLNNPNISGDFTLGVNDVLDSLDLGELPESLALADLRLDAVKLGNTDEDDAPDTDATEPRAKLGDVWQLGDHRLACGDATNANTVLRLFAGNMPFLMVTDPPYGVNYDPGWRDAPEVGEAAPGKRSLLPVVNDDRCDWLDAWKLWSGAVAYVWACPPTILKSVVSLTTAGLEQRSLIVWVKQNFVLSRMHYHPQHELCLYMNRPGADVKWCGGRGQSTVWEITAYQGWMVGTGADKRTEHSAQKPVDCMSRPILNHGEPGDSVYDPFSGSGSTLIACEQTGRRFVGCEIEPRYVDVAVTRWEQFTGNSAQVVARGS